MPLLWVGCVPGAAEPVVATSDGPEAVVTVPAAATDTGWVETGKRYLDIALGELNDKSRVVVCGDGSVAVFGAQYSTPFPAGRYTQADAGTGVACAIDAARRVHCVWDEYTIEEAWWLDEEDFVDPAGEFVEIAAGDRGACGITVTGEVECWGSDGGVYYPIPTLTPTGSFVDIDMFGTGGCGVHDDGELECWGTMYWYEGFTGVPPGTFTAVAVGGEVGCAIRTSGETACWLMGDDYADDVAFTPPGVALTALYGSFGLTCGLDTGGGLVCWGRDTESDHWNPPDPTLGPFVDLTLGGSDGCVLSAGGQAVCWNWWPGSTSPSSPGDACPPA